MNHYLLILICHFKLHYCKCTVLNSLISLLSIYLFISCIIFIYIHICIILSIYTLVFICRIKLLEYVIYTFSLLSKKRKSKYCLYLFTFLIKFYQNTNRLLSQISEIKGYDLFPFP